MAKIMILALTVLSLGIAIDDDTSLMEEKTEYKAKYETQYNIIYYYKQIAYERKIDKEREELKVLILEILLGLALIA